MHQRWCTQLVICLEHVRSLLWFWERSAVEDVTN
jgi:hypothetical protein